MTQLQYRNWIWRIRRPAAGATLALGTAFLIAVVATLSAQAQTFSVLYTFTGGTDGNLVYGGVNEDSRGNVYGTTFSGGAFGVGTFFKVGATGTEKVLHSFSGTGGDAAYPSASLVHDSAGNFYGTSEGGGATGHGAVFKLSKTGQETTLYSFGSPPDGNSPFSTLIRDSAGNLYGTTCCGGTFNYGTVFKVDPSGNETVLYSFTGGADGASPLYVALLRDGAGNLYGTTQNGGDTSCNPPYGCGTVFKLDSAGNETVLYSFVGGTDGQYPLAGVIRDASGNFYGTTSRGGSAGAGTVFKLNPRTGKETVLYTFQSGPTDGDAPYAGLVMDSAGNLYGTTYLGGSEVSGTVFELQRTGQEVVLHSFSYSTDGGYPLGGSLVIDAAGNLYGGTSQGGAYVAGTVYKLTP